MNPLGAEEWASLEREAAYALEYAESDGLGHWQIYAIKLLEEAKRLRASEGRLAAALKRQAFTDWDAGGEMCWCADGSGLQNPPKHWPGCVQAKEAISAATKETT